MRKTKRSHLRAKKKQLVALTEHARKVNSDIYDRSNEKKVNYFQNKKYA